METGLRTALSYYEDFGLTPDASPEQIREAYRVLVRLLHPDQQTDPVLKRAAEGQMRRINRAYAVLSDPERRRHYHAEIRVTQTPPPAIPIRPPAPVIARPQPQIGLLIWIAAAVVSLGALLFLATQGQQIRIPLPSPGEARAQHRTNQPTAAAQPAALPAEQQTTAHEQLPSGTSAAPNPAAPAPADIQTVTPPASNPPNFATPQLPAPTLAVLAPRSFGGFWAYPHEKNFQRQSGLYPPQFIEASITEHDGAIHGKYRARYYVSDRPISPNVNFEFEGKPEGAVAKLPWHGEGGSQGELEIKLLSRDEMELIWHATDFGQVLGLASGTAVLMRRPE